MAKYGAMFTQEGVPVRRAAEYQKVLDSRWRFLEINQEFVTDKVVFPHQTYTSTGSNTQRVNLFEHGMPYLPMWQAPYANTMVMMPNGQVMSPFTIEIDDRYVYMTRSVVPGYESYTYDREVRVRLYDVDFNEEYRAPSYQSTPMSSSDTDYGAKFVHQAGDRIDDTHPEAFTLNTGYKTLSIHSVQKFEVTAADQNVNNASGGFKVIEHDVGYPPTFMIAQILNINGKFIPRAMTGGSQYISSATGFDIRFRGVQGPMSGWYGLVILKDPAEVAA